MTGVAVISSILVIFTIVGLLLNGAVLAALVYNKFWKIPSTFLLFNLALVDFLTCAFIMPFMAVPGLAGGHYNFGNNDYDRCQACQAGVVIVVWLLYTSMHIIATMSLDRLIYIKRPLEYEKWITVPRLAIVLAAIWIICLILAIPPLFGFGEIGFSQIVGTCSTLFNTETSVGQSFLYILFLVLEVMFPLGLLIVTNIWLLCFVCKGIKNRFANTYQQKGEAKISEVNKQAKKKYIAQQIRMVKVFGSIFASNFATWAPVVVVLLAIGAAGDDGVPPAAFGVIFLCFLIQSVVHPMLESLLSARVRKLAKKVFCVCCLHKKARVAKNVTLNKNGTHNTGNLELSIKKN